MLTSLATLQADKILAVFKETNSEPSSRPEKDRRSFPAFHLFIWLADFPHNFAVLRCHLVRVSSIPRSGPAKPITPAEITGITVAVLSGEECEIQQIYHFIVGGKGTLGYEGSSRQNEKSPFDLSISEKDNHAPLSGQKGIIDGAQCPRNRALLSHLHV